MSLTEVATLFIGVAIITAGGIIYAELQKLAARASPSNPSAINGLFVATSIICLCVYAMFLFKKREFVGTKLNFNATTRTHF